MKMAKATERDIDAAGELMQVLDAIDARFGGPWPTEPGAPEDLPALLDGEQFDSSSVRHLEALYNHLARLLRTAPNFHGRVIGGMCYVILYDKNQIVDPDSDTLELHPRFAKANEQDAPSCRSADTEGTGRITPNGSSPAASPILAAPASEQGEREAFEGLSAKLWCDLRTDEERSAWLLLGRGHETGVVAKALQNDLAMAYHRLALLSAATPSAVSAEARHGTREDAYDQIDRFLRNNMDDESYAHYSQALDLVWGTSPADNKENGNG